MAGPSKSTPGAGVHYDSSNVKSRSHYVKIMKATNGAAGFKNLNKDELYFLFDSQLLVPLSKEDILNTANSKEFRIARSTTFGKVLESFITNTDPDNKFVDNNNLRTKSTSTVGTSASFDWKDHKYSVGDEVVVVPIDEQIRRVGTYGDYADTRHTFIDDMEQYIGVTAKIESVDHDEDSYKLDCDTWSYSRDMLILADHASFEPPEPVDFDITDTGLNHSCKPAAPESTIWKNPKKKVLNKKEIVKGDLVMVDNRPILSTVTSVKGDKVNIKFKGDKKVTTFCNTDVYPMYKQADEPSGNIKSGDIFEANEYPFPQVVASIKGSVITTTKGFEYSVYGIDAFYAKSRTKKSYNEYKCGLLQYNGKDYKTLKGLKGAYPSILFSPVVLDFTKDHEQIAGHYSVGTKDLKPKEFHIHTQLETTLDHPLNVAAKEWALLVGPSGSGKTEAAIAYANDNNRTYMKLQGNSQVTTDDLIGYKSITTGEYFPSLLRKAVEEGLLFILDEIDSCNPNTLLTLNGLKQEYFQFPDELVKIHKDFRMVATANTLEYSEVYNARSPMDKATIARFDVIHYDMEPHELAIRYGFKYVKDIQGIDRLTPRDVSRIVTKKRIAEETLALEKAGKEYVDIKTEEAA